MTNPDQVLESAIVAAGANVAPRITPAAVEANIEIAYYFTGEQALQFADLNGTPRPDRPAALKPDKPSIESGMSFGLAIEALKSGKRAARAGWNGKGMWLSLSCSSTRDVPAENFWSPHNAEFARENGGVAKVLPSITMKTASGEILMGWLASQADMLADDWQTV